MPPITRADQLSPEGASAGGDGNGFVLPANTNLPECAYASGACRPPPHAPAFGLSGHPARRPARRAEGIGAEVRVDRDTVLRSMPVG